MKKLLFLLLLATTWMQAQVSTGQEAEFDYGIKNNSTQTVTTPTYISTLGTDGTNGKIPSAYIEKTADKQNSLTVDGTGIKYSTVDAVNAGLDLKKNATSTAITSTATLTNNGTTFTLSAFTGVIVDNSTVPAGRTVVNFAGASNVTPLYFRTILYVNNSGTLIQLNGATTDLTPQQKRDNLFVGIVVYVGGSVSAVQLIPTIEYNTDNRLGDLMDFLGNINQGNIIAANGANLQINKGAGMTLRRSSNFVAGRSVPDVTTDVAATPIPSGVNLVGYRNGSGGWTYEAFTGSITPTFWDNGTGTKATVANSRFTNQQVYFFNGTNTYVIYLGQAEYSTLDAAKTAATTAGGVIIDSATSPASLRATISVDKACTALNNTSQAYFTPGPKISGGNSGGAPTGSQNLQSVYLNSSSPQVITSTALGSVDFQRGSAADTDNVFRVLNGAGSTTSSITGNGAITGLTYNGYTPANDANVLHKSGNEIATGIKEIENIVLTANPTGSTPSKLKQVMATDDFWSIYGEGSVTEQGKMVFEVGDNALPFASGGEKFEFRYNASASGTAKTPFVIDYNEITALANITATSFIKSGATAGNILLAGGTDIAQSTFATATGGTGYIQNQNASAQTADMFISGNISTNTQVKRNSITSGTSSTPNYEPSFVYGLSTTNLAGMYGGNSFGSDNGTFLKFRVNAIATPSTPVDALTIIPSGAATFASTVTASPATLSTQLATLGQVNAVRPYLVYTALVSQSGTSAPTATVLENTLGGTVVWTRGGTGSYVATLTGVFTSAKTICFITTGDGGNILNEAYRLDSDRISVVTRIASTGAQADDSLGLTSFEIRVYP